MKITEFEILRVPPSWVWVRIHTDTELTGLGEPHLEGHSETVITEVKRLEPLLIGKDPCRVEELWHLMYGEGYVGGPIKMSAISGIDIALWDLAGKAAGLPIHKMLGGPCHDRIRMYHATRRRAPLVRRAGTTLPRRKTAGEFADPRCAGNLCGGSAGADRRMGFPMPESPLRSGG